jgi:hypothetical protein
MAAELGDVIGGAEPGATNLGAESSALLAIDVDCMLSISE